LNFFEEIFNLSLSWAMSLHSGPIKEQANGLFCLAQAYQM